MGRGEEAGVWVRQGLEIEGSEADLVGLLKEIERAAE
jgi:translocation protein SEC72